MSFTRMTVVGTTHRCELVVPSDEILGAVLPRMLDLLHEAAGPVTRPLRLVLPTGDQLDVDRTPAEQRLLDGAVVRLVRAEEVPPPPEVADVTDVLGDEFGARTDLWSDGARTVTGSVALAAVGAAGAGLLPATTAQRLLAIGAVLLLALVTSRLTSPPAPAVHLPSPPGQLPSPPGQLPSPVAHLPSPVAHLPSPAAQVPIPAGHLPVPAGRGPVPSGPRSAGGPAARVAVGRAAVAALTGLALGIAAVTALRLALAPGVTATGWVLPVATALGLLGWACTGAGIGLGLGSRPALAGSGLGLLAACVPPAAAGLGPERAAAVGATAAVVACGLLPRYAAAAAGLTALDSAVLGGRLRRRTEVRRGVDRAYSALTWSVCGVAWTLAATSGVLLGSTDGWAAGLGVAVVTVTALRTRGFPIAAQQMALWSAVLAGLVVGGFGRMGPSPREVVAGIAAVAAAVLVLTLARPPAHTRAALRQLGDVLETVAVVAMVPLLVGLFGVYSDLLGAF
ncbi:MAG TPA: EsaB/YukD family protein [Mycobacteriales bacterium]